MRSGHTDARRNAYMISNCVVSQHLGNGLAHTLDISCFAVWNGGGGLDGIWAVYLRELTQGDDMEFGLKMCI